LRPLAKALGTSPRMLLYDFGSKEQLIDEVLAQVRRREETLL
jgi:AcrR family transcriptional regulator